MPPKADLEKLYIAENRAQHEIALLYQVSQPQVGRWLRLYDIPTRHRFPAEMHGNWKGGVKRTSNGRVKVRQLEHPRADGGGYVYRHILVYESIHGPLPIDHVIHHINGIKDDDRSENLIAMPRDEHSPRLLLYAVQERVRILEAKLSEAGVFK